MIIRDPSSLTATTFKIEAERGYMRDDLEITLNRIASHFNTDEELLVSSAYGDGGINPLYPRLLRAAINQCDDGDATLSRYAIWANTVRDHISAAMHLFENGEKEEGSRLLIAAHNSLSAFSEIQKHFDPLKEA